MNNKAKRIVSLFLILAMVLGILPAISPPVRGEGAEEITVTSWEELVNAMTSHKNYSKVKLGNDMEYEYRYDTDHPDGIGYLVNVDNEKTLDLNGKKIELIDQSSSKRGKYEPAAFFIRPGGTLHVIDSVGGGEVWHHSQLSEKSGFSEAVKNRTNHNVFINQGGNLIIDGGKFIAGRKSKTWCFNVHADEGMPQVTSIYYNGWAYNLSSGNAVRHYRGDTVINDGTFHSYGESTIMALNGTNSSGRVTINGGDYRLMGAINYESTSVINVPQLNDRIDFQVNGGNFSTEKMIVRRGKEGSAYSYEWNVYLLEPYIAIGTSYMTFNEDAKFKYDGKERTLAWIKSNLPKSSKRFEVIPGTPKLSLSPEVENDFYQLSTGIGDYTITGQVEPYFKDLGLGREANLTYNFYNHDLASNTSDSPELVVDTSEKGLTTYSFIVNEFNINGKNISNTSKYFDVRVSDEPIPKITILPETNPVVAGEKVKLVAYSDKADHLMEGYEWKYHYEVTDIGEGKVIEFNAPSVDGEYLIQCVGSDIYGKKGVGLFLLQVGGEGAAPRIATDELIFKQDKNSNGIYVENIGGPVDNKDWSLEGDLPPGLEFVTNIGLPGFRGTATEAGVWPVKIKADVVGGYEKTINIIVTAPIEIRTNPKLPDGVKGEEYQGEQLYVSGGGDVKWTVIGGALPKGLDLNINTGEISGTPEPDYSGEFKFTVRADATGEIPATKEFRLYIHAKPEFEKDVIVITAPYGKETYFSNYLKDGTGDIEYWLTGPNLPIGVGLVPANDPNYGLGRIVVGNNVKETEEGKPYKFTLHARGYDNQEASTNIELKVTKAPTLTDGMFIYLPYGEVGELYSDNEMIKNSIFSAKNGTWELKEGSLPDGLEFSNDGKISGTPTKDTGISSNGYPGFERLILNFTDKDGLPETVHAFLYIVEANGNKATSKIAFDISKENVQSATKAIMNTGMVNQLFIDIDGVPRPEYEITGLPDWITHSATDGKGNIVLQSTFPPETGTFNFNVKAKNDLNGDWVSQNLTIEVKNPEKASPPTVDKPSGTYKKSKLTSINLSHGYNGKIARIYYSINGGEFTGVDVKDPTKVEIPINGDTTIRAYTDTLFGLTGVEKSNSDIVTYNYTIIEDEAKALISINNTSLPDGELGVAYTTVALEGSSSNGEALTWTVTGLPAGLSLDSTGKKIEGSPSEAGEFNVTLLASAEGATSASKVLHLHIADKPLPKADSPSISSQPVSKEYNLNASATALTVKATADGDLSYLWYESQDKSNETLEDDKIVAMEKDFTPPTNREGEKYYYALVTNSKEGHQAGRATSNLATIKVEVDAQTPYFDDTDNREYLFTQGTEQTIMEMALVDDDGVLSYEWYKMNGSTPNPASDTEISQHDNNGALTITTPATNGAVDRYYTMVTNTKGEKTAGPVQSPIHIIEVTNKVRFEITFDLQNDDLPEDEKTFTVTTDFDGKLGGLPQPEREGFTLKGWYKEANGTSEVTSDEVYTKNTRLYAQWTEDTYTVTVQDDGKGTASSNPSSGVAGTEINITATPNEGYKFKEWQVVDGGITIVDDKFTMPAENVVIKAIFEEMDIPVDKSTLTAAISSANTNKGTAVVSTDGTDIDPSDKWVSQAEMDVYTDAITTAQAVAENASASQSDVDNAVAALNTATNTFNNAKKAGTKVTIKITGVNISPKTTTVEKGKTLQFTATVTGTGSYDDTVIWDISGNNHSGTTIDTSGLLTVALEETATSLTVTATSNEDSNFSDDATVTVSDIPITTYTVTVNKGTGGGTHAVGATVSITADSPPAGKEFDRWISSDLTLANENARTTTFEMPANNVTITATYKDAPVTTYAVTVNSGTGGGDFAEGATVSITANAAETGKVFDKWTTTDGVEFANANSATTTFVMPAKAVTVIATYKDAPVTTYAVTVNSGTGGGDFAEGATVSITANAPATGKVFDKWTTTDGITFGDANSATTTFVMPAKAVTVTATYKDISSETPDYKIISGENGIWKKGNTKGIVIISNGDYGDFTGVNVDGIFIDSSNYTSAAGSTVVTLKPAYLETLAVGTHIVTLQFGNYSVQTNLTILAADERPDDSKPNEEIPKTGDSNHTLPLIGLLLLSGSALIGVTRNKKKKKSYNK